MKNLKRIAIFMVALIVLCTVMSVTAVAASASSEGEAVESGKLDMNLKPESFEERLEYALQGTATGMLMIFGVLGLLTLILYGSKYVFYDMPSKAKNKEKTAKNEVKVEAAPAPVETPAVPAAQDDGELAAVITAAIAAMLESDEYKNEFVGGFRVVSFKRSSQGAWNRK